MESGSNNLRHLAYKQINNLGLSNLQVATEIGCDISELTSFLKGLNPNFPGDNRLKLCNVLNINPNHVRDFRNLQTDKISNSLHATQRYHTLISASDLETKQQEFLKVLMNCEVYFLPVAFADYSTKIYVIQKYELIEKLINYKWVYQFAIDYYGEQDVYTIIIAFDVENESEASHIKIPVGQFSNYQAGESESFSRLELYLTKTDFLAFRKTDDLESNKEFWQGIQ